MNVTFRELSSIIDRFISNDDNHELIVKDSPIVIRDKFGRNYKLRAVKFEHQISDDESAEESQLVFEFI